ncbi:MAG: anhydro-N-acetylmuramic acid kinase [Proteobacteria bacterium]|nr:anhydro-N-acetylmuramic acid kinase [Pseudomonadota bacterium]
MKRQVWNVVGLMSGTSLDGVDVVLLRTDGKRVVELLGRFYRAYPAELRARLSVVAQGDIPLNDLLQLERDVSEQYAWACIGSGFLRQVKVDVIGCHGQTIRHLPAKGLTWQLGDPNWLAERVEVPVVMDFRRRDMAAGGEGAPLVPLFHEVMLAKAKIKKPCALLNIGGVANVTLVGRDGNIMASDCGPGMGLLDAWVQRHTQQEFDVDGALSQRGVVDEAVVRRALAEIPFWQRVMPRSADRYEFYPVLEWLRGHNVADGAATLAALTVAGVDATLRAMGVLPTELKGLFVVGGGGHNAAIMQGFGAAGWAAKHGQDLGWEPQAVEAACFAWLAVRRLRGLALSQSSTTGCRGEPVGGVLTA